MRKRLKTIFKVAGLLVLFLLLFVIAIPFLFKDEIIETVRKTVDNRIEGAFYFEKADVGILRTFPNLCLDLTSPVLTGGMHPDGDSLFKAESLGVIVDIKSLLKRGGTLKVVGIEMIRPSISLYADADGNTNYQLIEASTDSIQSDTSTSTAIVEIEKYLIENGNITYQDDESEIDITLTELNHQGSLRYAQDIVELMTKTESGIATIVSEGIAFLDGVQIKGKNDLNIDLNQSVYTLLENHVTLNAFAIDASGVITQTETSTGFDLKFSGERNSFKNLISLLPNIYSSDFNNLNASGNISMQGELKGEMSEQTVPMYQLQLEVDNGQFQYPGKSLGFKDIAFQGRLHNSAADWSPVFVDLAPLHFSLNNRPFDAKIKIQNPTGKGTYIGEIKGSVDLSDVQRAYPMADVKALQGILDADVVFDLAPDKPTDQQRATGSITLANFSAQMEEETLAMQSAKIDFTPSYLHALTNGASLNGAAMHADVQLRNYIGWLTNDQVMVVNGDLSIDKFDANKYMTTDESIATPETTAPLDPALSKIQFEGSIAMNTLLYDTYVIENGSARLKGTLPELQIIETQGKINGTQFTANGQLKDLHTYMDEKTPLAIQLDCQLDKVYVDRWIASDEPAEGSGSVNGASYVALPADLVMDVTFRADEILYDQIRIQNSRGVLHMEDRILEIHEFKGTGMGGNIAFSGLYNTQNIEHPAFSMKYDMTSIKFSEAFAQIETFQTLAPIVKFVQGIFNAALVFEGRLGENYIPDFNTLTAKGYLETLSGSLQQTDILEKVSAFLNLKKPLKWDLANTRNWFEVRDGYLLLQEVTKSIDGIEVGLGGRHQIKGDMDYLIKLNIPADRISENPVGALAKAGFEQIQSKASSIGIKLNTIESFVVHVGMKGKLADPKFQILLFDASGKSLKDVAAEQLTDIKEQIKDTVTTLADEKIEAVKDSIRTVIDRAVDSARIAAEEKLKEAGQDILKETTAKLDSTIRDSITNAVLDKLGDKTLENLGKKETDQIKDALEKWDPFKKKKN